ncbi:MAG TPA: hypothetical protein VJJ55_01440 [Candidatus Paceibacterota bacterium]
MNYKKLIELPTEPEQLMQSWTPRIRFAVPSALPPNEYLRFLHSLFEAFIRDADPEQHWNAFAFGDENGGEGGMSGFHFRGEYFDHCKLYGYDGTRTGQNYQEWKGFMIRNHDDQRSRTPRLYSIADSLEEVLRGRGLAYERFGLRLGRGEEELQSAFVP